jgi:hypothetical protein
VKSAEASNVQKIAFLPTIAIKVPHPSEIRSETELKSNLPLPHIFFEKTVCDLGNVGQGTKNTCEFRFTNTGRGLLKIGQISHTCGCTVFQLDKKEYAPGQTGTIKVIYTSGKSTVSTQKSIYVPTNDKDNPKVKLTVKARIVQLVQVTPEKLELSLREENVGIPGIQLESKNGKPFSIKDFKSTNRNSIVADFDPNVSASKFVLQPEVNIEKLKTQFHGFIEIQLTHPQCRSVRISYEVLAEFKAIPRMINILNANPQESITREVIITSNYGEDFIVESTSSKNDYIKVLSQEKIEKSYKFKIQIAPPLANQGRFFSDTFYVDIKDKDKLSIGCRGYYSKKEEKPDKSLAKFKAEPKIVKTRDAEPGKPLIREVLVSGSDNEVFEIESASSQKGTVKLLSKQKLGNRYKLRLKITPPPSKHRLEIFSDVLYVNIRSNRDSTETTKLSITIRGSYSRRPKK